MIVSRKAHPPIGIMGGSVHSYERGKSPWHVDAFPDEHKRAAPERGKRVHGWFAVDWCGNYIGFFADGTVFPDPPNPERSGPTADAASKPDVAGSADAKLLGADVLPEGKT